jgi:hypothetical protein
VPPVTTVDPQEVPATPDPAASEEDIPEHAGPTPPRTGRLAGRTLALHAAVIVGLALVSVVMWWHVWITGHPTQSVVCQCGDISEELGYLAWMPYALAHLHNPLLSHAIYAGQGGANMLANTSNLAMATLLAPVTWLFGPVATFNVAVTLAPVVSGWSFFLVARRLTSFVPGQIAGAVLYGFAPTIVTSVTVGHFFLAWMWFPPLAFLCLYDLLVDRRHRPVTMGVALGLLVVLQFFSGTELLAMSGVVAAIGLLAAVIAAPQQAWARHRRIAVGVGAAAVTAGVLLAYPLWFVIDGPQRVVGLAWPGTSRFGSYLSAIVTAGPGVTQASPLLRLSGYYGPSGPPVVFLGWGVIVFLALSAVVWYRRRLAWVVLALGAASWALSLGPGPKRHGHDVGIWLPDRALMHIPLLNQIIPARFSALTGLAAALLLTISLDCWWKAGRLWIARRRVARAPAHAPAPGAGRRGPGLVWAGLLTAVVIAALVPVATSYRFPLVLEGGPVPAWFTTAAARLDPGTVVLTVPYPSSGLPQAMGWQAEADLRFRLVSGYAIVPGRDGRHSAAASPFGGADALFDRLSFGLAGPQPTGTAAQRVEVWNTLHRWGVQVVVVTPVGRDPSYATAYFTAVFGRAPRAEDGSWAWHGFVGGRPVALPPGTIARCAADPDATAAGPDGGPAQRPPVAAAACVLAAARVEQQKVIALTGRT